MRYVVVGTAGHIDHGKTELVKALTGIDTDRLREEKERGITIDLGFAHLELSPEVKVGIVDVPGHERFVRNMVAGASGIDLVMLVIAADEGVMPQTREHLAICQFLGVQKGLVVLSKADLVDAQWLEMVRQDVEGFLQGTFLEGAPVVITSAVTGRGIADLKAQLLRLCLEVPPKGASETFRMPIDRAFHIKGFGLVVTGTVYSGVAHVGDTLEILPKGIRVRVRGLQIHGGPVEEVPPGCRAAINLAGAEKGALRRGDVLVTPGHFAPSTFVDLSLRLLPQVRAMKNWSRVRFHWGTGETMGRVKLLDRDVLKPGDEAEVRLHLEGPVVTAPGDPFVVRSFSPVVTVGGGRILDSNPSDEPARRRVLAGRLQELKGESDKGRLLLFLRWAGEKGMVFQDLLLKTSRRGTTADVLRTLEGEGVCVLEGRYFHPQTVEGLRQKVLRSVEAFFQENPLRAFVSKEELAHRVWDGDGKVFAALLAEMHRDGKVVLRPEGVSLPGAGPRLSIQEQEWLSFIRGRFREAGFAPPTVEEVFRMGGIPLERGRGLVEVLVERGELVKISKEFYMERGCFQEMLMRVSDFFSRHEELTVGDFKELLRVSRRYAVPYLEFLDAQGYTRRVGNVRRAKRLFSEDQGDGYQAT